MSTEINSVEVLAKVLEQAQKRNYQIVPIVGAGLSADCGFPVITSVVRYFGKLHHYIHAGMGLPPELRRLQAFRNQYKWYLSNPWAFVEDFGWPDRFQLNEELVQLNGTPPPGTTSPVTVDVQVGNALDNISRVLNMQGWAAFYRLRKDIAEAIATQQNDQFSKDVKNRFKHNKAKSTAFDVIGDWRRLILHFTNYQSDYADGLFARFGANRQPGLGHIFLTYLIKLFAIPTIFTFNFDSLIEQALQAEGAAPRVFGMERGVGLPHPSLTRGQLSVIKMHGSTHALLLDEELDHPLSPDYLNRFEQLTSARPLLLVVGCSDGDRRLRDLVSHVIRRVGKGSEAEQNGPSVIWLHYEDNAPQFLTRDGNTVFTCNTNNPGATLQHIYSYLTSENPAGRRPYLAHIQQPVHLGKLADKKQDKTRQFELIANGDDDDDDWLATPSYALLHRGNYWARKGFHFIWVDLEALHTLAGVVASIIDQCRKYDPDLAPSLLPFNLDYDALQEDSELIAKTKKLAANRVARALRRTRYYIAFDSLEKFVSPATTHHGLTHLSITKGAGARLDHLIDFLVELTDPEARLGESMVGISVDKLKPRFADKDLEKTIGLGERVKRLKEFKNYQTKAQADFEYEKHFEKLEEYPLVSLRSLPAEAVKILKGSSEAENKLRFALVLFNLSCFRRTRPLVALRRLIAPIIGGINDLQQVDKLLNVFSKPSAATAGSPNHPFFLKQLEGGGYWYNHRFRDYVYSLDTEYGRGKNLKHCLDHLAVDDEKQLQNWRSIAFQLTLSAITHERIADIWYANTFVQSQDSYAFLEFTYHRISAIRSIAKLRALLSKAADKPALRDAFLDGLISSSKLITPVGVSEPAANIFEWSNTVVDEFTGATSVDINQISKALAGRHESDLITLHRAWSRAETLLRSQLPAEQLLHWCEELLNDDLVNRCNRLVREYKLEGDKYAPVLSPAIDQEIEDGPITNFRNYLRDLQVKIWTERSDYDICINTRTNELEELKNASDGGLSPQAEAHKAVSVIHKQLDIANSEFKRLQEETLRDQDLKARRLDILTRMNKIEASLQSLPMRSTDDVSDRNEAYLRLLHIKTDCELGHVSAFTHDGFTGDRERWVPEAFDLPAARATIEKAFTILNTQDVHIRQTPRSVMVDPTAESDLYPQYRSIFHMLRGRVEWLAGSGTELGFDRAAREFETARAGSNKRGHLLSALIELYSVEAFLAQTRALMYQPDNLEKVPQLHRLARAALSRARQFLLASRGHMQGRKLFFRLTAQYHSDRLMRRYVELATRRADTGSVPEISKRSLVILRRGYQALLTALDLYLPDSTHESSTLPHRFRWLYRIWWELTLTAYLIGCLAIQSLKTETEDGQTHEQVIETIKSLNKLGGLSKSELGSHIINDIECLGTLAEEVKKLSKAEFRKAQEDLSEAGKRPAGIAELEALLEQRSIISQAAELSMR